MKQKVFFYHLPAKLSFPSRVSYSFFTIDEDDRMFLLQAAEQDGGGGTSDEDVQNKNERYSLSGASSLQIAVTFGGEGRQNHGGTSLVPSPVRDETMGW
jgi:hypothetical protein